MAFVINDPEMGVYLGSFIGLGFWSKLDPAGQPSAITFPSESEAEAFMATWESGRPTEACLVPVQPDEDGYASIAACVRAGLDGWLDELIPSANSLAI
jgi:hypothetical protein